MKKQIAFVLLFFTPFFIVSSGLEETELQNLSRAFRKYERRKQGNESNPSFLEDCSWEEKAEAFKHMKRRPPKKYERARVQGENWPDDFGFNPKKPCNC